MWNKKTLGAQAGLQRSANHIGEIRAAQLRAEEMQENALLIRIRELKRWPGAQSEYHFQGLKRTYEELLKYLPKQMVTALAKASGAENEATLALEFFKNTLVLPPMVFKELLKFAGVREDAVGFYYNGHSIIRTTATRLPPTIIIPLLHEWMHAFDAATGLARSTKACEAIAYGLHMFIQRTITPHKLKRRAIRAEVKTSEGREYAEGFALGKRIAMTAMELKGRSGEHAVKKFFETLIMNRDINLNFIKALKEELLQSERKSR
jgi:hypothetical protein